MPLLLPVIAINWESNILLLARSDMPQEQAFWLYLPLKILVCKWEVKFDLFHFGVYNLLFGKISQIISCLCFYSRETPLMIWKWFWSYQRLWYIISLCASTELPTDLFHCRQFVIAEKALGTYDGSFTFKGPRGPWHNINMNLGWSYHE